MKNIYNILGMIKVCLCVLVVLLVIIGCLDLLDKELFLVIFDGSFWIGEGDVMLVLIGCYCF